MKWKQKRKRGPCAKNGMRSMIQGNSQIRQNTTRYKMTFDKYLSLKRLAHAVRSWEEFTKELSKLDPKTLPIIPEGYRWFYERYKERQAYELS
jgi:hypothetical protein